jgi:hypothetical protein
MNRETLDWRNQLLEELIYERVRVHVDLAELLDFERDLTGSIRRALDQAGVAGEDADQTTRRYVEAAWRRIEAEWDEERERDDHCPVCAEGRYCSALAF